MIEPLRRFIEDLRGRGLSVSPAEAIDAARAAAAVGPEDRARFRDALGMTLAKDLRSLDTFDEAFERFFAPPARVGAGKGKGLHGGAGGAGGAAGTGDAGSAGLRSRRRPEDDSEPSGSKRASRRARSDRAAPRSLRALPPEEMRRELGKARLVGDPRPAGPGASRAASRKSDPARRPATPGRADQAPSGDRARSRASRLLRLLAAEERVPPAAGGHEDPRRRDLAASMSPADERALSREIPRIVEEIRLRRARRMRRAPRGRLFMKRVIRENIATGGVPFRIPMRRARLKRPRVVLVVDVSWSVATASGLFLLLAMEFLRLDRRMRVFFFVDHPVDATEAVRGWMRRGPGAAPGAATPGRARGALPLPAAAWARGGARPEPRGAPTGGRGRPGRSGRGAAAGVLSPYTGRSFGELLSDTPGIDPGAASDYGRAFWSLSEGPLRRLARDAVLVVLGDARTNRFDPLPWAFEEIASRARRVLWLAPEPRARWGTGDSALPRYLPFCDVAVEARDLEGLAHGVREMAASL